MNLRFAALLASALICPLAQAYTNSASASVQNIDFHVVDLKPGDAVQASYSFFRDTGNVTEAYYPSGTVAEVQFPWQTSSDAFAVLNDQKGDGVSSFYRVATGSNSLQSWALETQPLAYGHAYSMVSAGINSGSFEAPTFGQLLLVVSPHTRLAVSADFAAQASSDCSAATLASSDCRTTAFAFMQFEGAYSLGGEMLPFSSSSAAYVHAVNNESQVLAGGSIWFENPNDEFAIASFRVVAYADASLYGVSAVPEPGTWCMTALGLLVLAGRRRSLSRIGVRSQI